MYCQTTSDDPKRSSPSHLLTTKEGTCNSSASITALAPHCSQNQVSSHFFDLNGGTRCQATSARPLARTQITFEDASLLPVPSCFRDLTDPATSNVLRPLYLSSFSSSFMYLFTVFFTCLQLSVRPHTMSAMDYLTFSKCLI